MKKISKAEAIRKKLKRYYTGKLCKNGHDSFRYISGGCVACDTEKHRKRRKETSRKEFEQFIKNNRDRFISKLKNNIKKDKNGCWSWQGTKDRGGYGRIWVLSRGTTAHRVSFVAFNNKITKKECILHICDNPNCVNPNHLRDDTYSENMKDKVRKGRHRNY